MSASDLEINLNDSEKETVGQEKVPDTVSPKETPEEVSPEKTPEEVSPEETPEEAEVSSESVLNDSQKAEFLNSIQKCRDLVQEILQNDLTKHEDISQLIHSAKDLFENRLNIYADQIPDDTSKNEAKKPEKLIKKKPKRVIVKQNGKAFRDQIKGIKKTFANLNAKVLDENKILVSFDKETDRKKFCIELEKNFQRLDVYVEEDENSEVVIDNVGNITPDELRSELKKLTGEKPLYVRIVEVRAKRKWRAYVTLSGYAMIRLLSENDSIIRIQNVKSDYIRTPPWFTDYSFGRENCYKSKCDAN